MKEIIYKNETKERLDKFLASELADLSRSKIQHLIKEGQITVNGQNVSNNHQLKIDDKIQIEINQSHLRQGSGGQAPNQPINQSTNQLTPKVINETDDYLIINKPAGLIVHPAEGIKENTLTDWLKDKYPKVIGVGENSDRPGIVHRLDKEVSGAMIIALTQKMFDHLKKQFQAHQIKKEYLTLVHGKAKNDEKTITFPIERSKLSGKMVSRPKGEEGKESVTHFIVLKRFSRYTYLKVTLQTGRTHQIRSHLQAYGHPVVGDSLYRNKKIKENIELNRIFLHSHLLGFYDLENKWQEYQTDLPNELNNILTDLK